MSFASCVRVEEKPFHQRYILPFGIDRLVEGVCDCGSDQVVTDSEGGCLGAAADGDLLVDAHDVLVHRAFT
jgi:hypothetical protein